MKTQMLLLALVVSSTMSASSLKQEGGHTVRLSSGGVVRIAYVDEFAVDPATRKSAGGSNNVLLESSSGTLIGMRSRDSASHRVDTVIWSFAGPDRIAFDLDLESRRKGLPVQLWVDINGQRTRFLLKGLAPVRGGASVRSEDDDVREELAPQVAKLPADFTSALKELLELGHSGYPNMGTGWTDLRFVFKPSEIRSESSILSEEPMGADDRQIFVRRFAPK